jgi:hypothetical protein
LWEEIGFLAGKKVDIQAGGQGQVEGFPRKSKAHGVNDPWAGWDNDEAGDGSPVDRTAAAGGSGCDPESS